MRATRPSVRDVDLASHPGRDRRVPLVVEHERLDLGFGEVAVLLERCEVERGLRVLGRLLGGGLGLVET